MKMVYAELWILEGVVITKAQVGEFLFVDTNSDIFWETLEYYNQTHKYLYFFSFPCCSPIRNEFFIFGRKVHTYYRRSISCIDCQSDCNHFIGETNAGNYDVHNILSNSVQIPFQKICISCYSDQVQNGRCSVCFYRKEIDMPRLHAYEEFPDSFIEFFYMINDCLSCK